MFLALPICFGKSCFKHNTKVQKIRDETFYNHGFIMIYNLISLFSPLVGTPSAFINSSFFHLNQLTCETPSMLMSNLSSISCLREQTVPSVLKCLLNNSQEYCLPLVKTSLNMHSFLMTHRQTSEYHAGILLSALLLRP